MKKSTMMRKRLTLAGWLGLCAWAGMPLAQAQVAVTLTGPAQATSCGTVFVTNRFVNNGSTLNNLWITNELPSASYAYVPGLSTVTLPGGVVLTGAAADPDVNNGSTNLVWDFTAVVTPSTVTNLLITEVFYNPGLAPEDDNEWIEIYNPTTNAVDLTGWSIRDTAPGAIDALPAATINPGEFIVIAADTNAFLAANPTYAGQLLEIADGKIGSGLNNFGDGVLLRNAASATVDAVSYGASTAAFSPAVPTVAAGRSIARSPANNDTNTRNDWVNQATPDPGAGNLPTGLANGGAITIAYAVEIDCGAISGQLFARAGFEQPPGSPGTGTGSLFLSVNLPDLVVTKTPILQDGGVGDTVTWTVRVENAGFGAAPNVTALDRLGPGLAFTGFSVTPTAQTATNATWDATAIPAFTNLAAGAFVDIAVTAQVVSCVGLYNRADATWGCSGLQVLANETCEDTALLNETATAGIRFIDRYPSLSYSLDPAPIPVAYCGGTEVTLYVTNASGADIGTAYNVSGTPTLPEGWSISGASVDTNGVIQIDPLAPGATTAVTFRVEAGGDCPINTEEQNVYFRPYYEDACGNPFFGPLGFTTATVVDEPTASVTKIMPGSVSGDDGSFPVRIELAFANFAGTEQITLTDIFPAHTNLTVNPGSISAGGVLAGDRIVWANLTPGAGSGVVTASFDMVIGTPCGGPAGVRFNEVQATDYTNCNGCVQSVLGDGFRFPLQFNYGAACPQEPGLTGGCSFVSSKGVFPDLTEVCDPVMVTHTFTAFGGTLGDWTGVAFTADLAGGSGFVDTTNEVTVLIDGSNVTQYVAFTQTSPNLALDLSGLNGSSFPSVSNVTASLIIAYPVSVSAPGQYTDDSALLVPGCGTAGDEVTWNVGESRLEIDLMPITVAGSCAPVPGRIELEMLPSPEGVSGETALFPAYDVEVTLDMDFDGDLYSGYEYVAGSTVFSNLVDLAGTPLAAVDPTINGDQLTWTLGDLGTNTGMSISYVLRKRCGNDTNAQHRATVDYNTLCGDGTDPQSEGATSRTNGAALYAQPNLLTTLQPELQFLTDTQIVNQVRIMNSCAIDAFNLRVEMRLPANVSFGGAAIPPTTVTATNVVWDFHALGSAYGPLQDTDGDGSFDDLIPREVFEFWVTNNVDYCMANSAIDLSASYGCFGDACTNTPWVSARYETISGSLVTRATFPVENALCEVNPVEYSVRNSGLTIDYDVDTRQTLPAGMGYVLGSSEVSINGGTTNAIGDPAGSGLPGDPLVWDSALIPLLAAMQPNDQVTIFYDVALGCDVVTGDNRFIAEGAFTDLCGNRVTNREVVSVLAPKEPLLEVTKTSSLDAADLGEEVVYTVTISHDATSAADVPYLALTDVLPAAVSFGGASVTPDAVVGQTLIWSNATLAALTGDNLPPFALGEGAIQILVTGIVNDCAASVINSASVDYGCSESDACLTASDSVSLITTPRLTPPGLVSSMTLDTCGGTKTVVMTNSGASTDSDILYAEYAPPGYIFTGATASGEFTSAGLTVAYSGTPNGSIATVDFSSDALSGATDAKDDIGDGLANLELGKNSGFTVVWTLASAGDNLDCLADPTDLDYEDPEQGDPSSLTSSNRVTYTDLCGEAGSATGSNSAFPGIPDLDIDLQPNSLIVEDGTTVVFTLNVVNNSETTDAEGIHVRVKMGTGWEDLTYLSSNIVSSGATAMDYEKQGDTNLLFSFPGVVLDPLDDEIAVTFRATATTNGGFLTAVAEVVGDCGNPLVAPACTFSNVWGEAPLANSMTGSVIGAVNGQYYSFDQDRFAAAGHTLTKTVRYDEEAAGAAGTSRDARVGEDLIYRIEALYFGGEFSAVTITDSLPAELGFGTPVNYAFSGGITGAVWDAGTGVFTLQPATLATNPSTFAVDIPVVVSNRLDVQDGAVITNVATTDFTLEGVTNVPVERTTEVEIYEPVLQLTKTVNSNLVQAGDILIFTNRLVHTGASRTSAYSVVFTDTLPPGLAFSAFISPASGTVVGQTVSFNTNDLAALGEFRPGDPAIDFVFSALVVDQLVGATITNRSSATYLSLDNPSENGNERDGSDGPGLLNDYATTSQVTFASQPVKAIAKTFVSSSQTNTLTNGGTNDWTIGERFVYEIRVDVPQGVVSNLVLTDTVPAGIDWVGTNPDAALAYAGRGYEFEIPAGGPQFPTNAGAGLTITDTDPTPASSVLQDGSGLPVVFTFASITNAADGNLANDYFLLRLEFVALTNAANVGIGAGAATRGSNVVRAVDAFTTLGATGPVYRIVEHDVRAQKIRSPATADAGDVMTFTVVASNQVNALANAYDVMVADTLSSNVYDFSTFAFGAVTPGWATELIGTTGGRIFRMYSVADTALVPNSGATGVFTVALAQGVRPSQIYTNRMDVTNSTTLYGPPPGGIAERNDTANNSVTFTVPGLALAKAFETTSETNLPPDSTGSNVQIGEVLTYRLAITLPESTITNLTVVDRISTNGLAYIFGSARLDAATSFVGNVGSFVESPTAAPPALSTMGQTMTFTFTNVVTTGDNFTTNNTFYMLLDYLVLNDATNRGLAGGQTVHTNRATLTYGGNPGGTVTSAVVTTTVIEPRLTLAKNIVQANVDAGDVVDVQLTVTNSGLATAYDVAITDLLDTVYFDSATVSDTVAPTGFVFGLVGNSLTIRSDTNSPTGTNTIEVGEFLQFSFKVAMSSNMPPLLTTTNVATLTWDSLRSTNVFDVQRSYATNASDTIAGLPWSFAKGFVGTSEINLPPDSTTTNVQIGEAVTYQLDLTLPEGTVSNLTFRDFVPAGMAFVVGSVAVDTSSFNGTLPAGPTVTPNVGALGADGGTVTIEFLGDTVVAGDNDPGNNTLTLRLEALVLDAASVSGLAPQTLLTNRADVTYFNNPLGPSNSLPVVVQAIEPRLRIFKSLTPTSDVSADDVLSITLVVTNSGTATAYDVAVEDVFDPAIYDLGELANVVLPTGFVYEVAGNAFRILSDTNAPTGTNTIEVGESLTFTFDVGVANTLSPNVTVTNFATVVGDSLASTNVFGVERDTGHTNSATFVAEDFEPTKLLVATSETGPADSALANLQIGEIATYEITVELPDLTITNLTIRDDLPAGMAYVVGSLQINTNAAPGQFAAVTNVTPNVGPLGASGEDLVIIWEGNTLLEHQSGGADPVVVLRYDAVILDLPANSGLVPQSVLTNRASVTYTGNPNPPASVVGPPVTLIEPQLAISKTVSPDSGDAGDEITVTLVVTNSGLATAYDLDVSDVLDGTIFDTGTIANGAMPDGFAFSAVPGPADATVHYVSDPAGFYQPTNTLEVGESLEFTFTVRLAQAVEPGAIYTNGARLVADTIYETNAVGIQRGYTNSAQDALSISNMVVAKALAGTSETSPADSVGSAVQIGERATYRLTVTLPEATITNLTVTDVVPAGMSYVPLSVGVDVAGFGGSLPGAPAVATAGGSGDDVVFTFEGLTVVTNNNDGTDNSFAIEFDLLTLDVGANTGTVAGSQTVLPNSATVSYDGNPPVHTSGVVNVTVVEPVLDITKTMRAASNSVVVIDLVVTNRGLATAFDVELEDVLTTVWWDTDTIVPLTVPAGFTFGFAGNPGNATITIATDPASQQPTNSIEVGESLLFQFQVTLIDGAPSPVTNRATVTEYSSIDGSDPEEREYGPTEDEDVLEIPGYTLVKTLTSPTGRAAQVGETVTFNLVVANTGGVGLDPVPLVDTYDTTYLSYVGAAPASVDNANDGTINWTNVGPLAVGGSVTVAVEFVAIASTQPGDTTNRVVASPFTTNGLPLLPKTNEAPVEVVYVGYTLAKDRTSPVGRAAQVGEPIVFTITVVNTGEVQLVTVPVEDTYDTAYLTYVSALPASDNNANDGTLNWADIGLLPVGASTTIVATFTAAASTLGLSETNEVVTTPTTPPTAPPVPPQTNDAPYEISSAGYTLAKDRTSPVGRAAQVGEAITFEILVTNTGEVELVTVPVEDVYDTTYLTYVSALPASDNNADDGTLNWADIGPLPVGASTTIVATFTAASSTLGLSETNVVVTTPTTPPTAPPVPPQTNDAPYEIHSAGYTLEKDRTSPVGRAAQVGEAITFEILVTNTGDVELATVPVEDVYDTTYLTYVSSLPASDNNADDGTINWADIGPLPVGASTTIVATFTAASSTLGLSETNVVVTSPTTPPTAPPVPPQTNDAPYEISSAGYALAKDRTSPLGRPAIIGEAVTFEILVTNTGDVELATVPVEDTYETAYLTYVSSVPASDNNANDGTLNWADIGPLPVGASTTIVATFTGAADTLGADRTNVVVTSPTTPPTAPPVPPQTNDAPYAVDSPASLGNFVWLDVDGDGVQGGIGETGMPDVVVTLYDFDDAAIGTTTTDVAGAYAFTNLVPGDYYVGFARPSGYNFTLQDEGGNDALDSDANPATGRTIPTTLDSGENDLSWDAGLYVAGSLGNFVWNDLDADGIQDGGETGVVGVVVNLLTNGTVIATTTTDVNGAYAFIGLPPWDYQVQVVAPAGWYVSPQNQLLDDTVDSDVDVITGLAATTTLDSGENDPTWDAGLYLPASLGDFVWEDVDGDGVQDAGEPAVSNVTVRLYDAATNVLDWTTTDASGFYAFTNLVPEAYFVGFEPPAGWQLTLLDQGGDDALDSDADPTTGYAIPTVLTSGESDPTWDAGLYRPVSLGNFVWNDLNADGIQDGGETGVSNVTVNLLTNGTIIATTTTDADGLYAFTNLPPWDYQVQVVAPAGWYVSPQNAGGDDTLDSDVDVATGLAATTTLVSGENDPTWDAGLYLPASLGDFVWLDMDGDGIQDAGEAGLPNIPVDLYAAGGGLVASTTTDVNGAYAFTNLVPGDYYIDVDVPAGWFTSPPNQGGDGAQDSDIDSAGSTATTTLISGEDDPTWDAGLSLPASLGNFVWEDRDGDGIQDAGEPGIPNVTVRLYDATSNLADTTTTDANGLYAFVNLPAGPYFVQFARPAGYQPTPADRGADDAADSDASQLTGRTVPTALLSGEDDPTWDAGFFRPASVGDYVWLDENWDGVQDPGEEGLPNVRVQLLNSTGGVAQTTTTDINGLYLFSDLPPGTYTVRVDSTSLPAGLAANQTFDPDATRNHQTTVTLASGDAIRTADFGYNWRPPSSVLGAIGDRVWVDADADGAQDSGEPGIPNVRMLLFVDSNGDGIYNSQVASVLTDASGFYIFTNLPAGAYQVRVATNTLPAGYVQTGDPDHFGTDSTANPAQAGDHQTTAPIVLAPGDVFVNADFGYVPPTFSNLGDLIYFDANANGAYSAASGDYGIPGVTVALLNGAGKIIASTVTDSTGWYLFTGLPAGTYTVWVNDSANVLANLVQTGDPDGGLDSRSTTTLDGRHDDLLQDHGYTPDGHGPLLGLVGDTIFLDRDGNGLPGTGEGLQGVTVGLYDSPGFTLLATTVTDPNGRYYFGGLPAASYVVRVDTNTLPNGGVGLINTVDPDTANPGNSESLVTIGDGGINLLQDFGYVPSVPNAIGGTLWKDCNADGTLDSDETPRWQGVQIVLRDSSGDIVGTTFTDASGSYRFARLPNGAYTVDVNDVSNRLHGFWASIGPNPGADNNSQRKPYAISVSGGQTNTTGDFGYYLVVSELGDYIWYDINGNGLQDGGEPGLTGVKVTLHIRYPNGSVIALHALTDSSGRYRFANLLQDERYQSSTLGDPAVVGLPRFQILVDLGQTMLTADGYAPTTVNAGNGANDSRQHTGTFALLALCGRSSVYDFGFSGGPLLAVIGNVDAFTREGQTVVRWETIESWGTEGFWLERQVGGEWVRISQELIPFPLFGVAPIIYEEIDPSAEAGGTYRYRLVELENDGDILYYGPYELTVDGPGRTYDDWAAANFTAEELADPAIGGRAADPDGDGLTNEQEFLAGTDPKSADSVLQISDVQRVAGGFDLRWKTVPGRFYKIAVADSPFGPFLPLEGSILATDSTGRATVESDFSDRQMYFQVIRVDGP